MSFDPNENNRSLTPTGFKAFPTVSNPTGLGPMPNGLTSMSPMKPVPTASEEQVRNNANLATPMPRTKVDPTLPPGVSADQLRCGADGRPWGGGSR